MTSEQLAAVAGVILSLLFSYAPGLSDWYAAKDGAFKRLFMVGLMAAVALVVFGISCAGYGSVIGAEIACSQSGAISLVMAWIAAVIANQAAFMVSPQKQVEG